MKQMKINFYINSGDKFWDRQIMQLSVLLVPILKLHDSKSLFSRKPNNKNLARIVWVYYNVSTINHINTRKNEESN